MEFNYDLSEWYFNLNSSAQMQEFLYEFLGLTPLNPANQKTGNISVDESVITHYAEHEGIKFCVLLMAFRKLMKAKNTYLADIFRNISDIDFMLHPEFWLNTAETYRSSSTDPNFQNIPKHGLIIIGLAWKIIRRMFTSLKHPDWRLAEVDYVGAETKVAGMLGKDPQMIQDLNEDLDMHSHWAIEIFGLKGLSYKEVKQKYDETYRFLAKNNFTFANFFGAGPQSIAAEFRKSEHYEEYVRNKWNLLLNRKGNFDTYYIQFSESHIAECQQAFYSRYSIYKAWQDSLVKNYYKNGYVDNPFGFRRRYPLKRNEIINHPIQSTSFLLLLDSLINIEKEMEDSHWKSHFIGQIHDSGMANVYKYEAPEFIEMVDDKMTNKPHLPWTQSVKMDTDWSFGRNWLDMYKVVEYKYVN